MVPFSAEDALYQINCGIIVFRQRSSFVYAVNGNRKHAQLECGEQLHIFINWQWLEVRQPDLVGRARGPAEILRNFLRKKTVEKKRKISKQCRDRTRDLQLHSRERYLQAIRCRCCRCSKSQLYIDITTNTYNISYRCGPLVTNHTRNQETYPDPTIHRCGPLVTNHTRNPVTYPDPTINQLSLYI